MTRTRTVEIDVPMTTYDYDDDSVVVVIGSGAGGGTMADELSSQGVSVVVLEAGPRFKELDFTNESYVKIVDGKHFETEYFFADPSVMLLDQHNNVPKCFYLLNLSF